MMFGVACGIGQGMGVLDGGDDPRTGRSSFGGNLGRPIVTGGHFETRLFPNYFWQDLFHICSRSL